MNKKVKPNRKPFFRFIKCIMRVFVKKPKVINANQGLEEGSIFLCNHVGSTVPVKSELYFPHNFRFWGTYEMVYSAKERRKYLQEIYFYKKKHNKKNVAKLKGALASPFIGMFYKGMQLIPTYTDARLLNTVKTSLKMLNKKTSILIFPEDSSDGYHNFLTHYFAGFLLLAKLYYKNYGVNVKIYNMYYRKTDNTMIIDKYKTISEILETNVDFDVVANEFKDRANALSKITNIKELKDI